jgi:hypothetical protein
MDAAARVDRRRRPGHFAPIDASLKIGLSSAQHAAMVFIINLGIEAVDCCDIALALLGALPLVAAGRGRMDANIVIVLPIEERRRFADREPERLFIVALDAPEVAEGTAAV